MGVECDSGPQGFLERVRKGWKGGSRATAHHVDGADLFARWLTEGNRRSCTLVGQPSTAYVLASAPELRVRCQLVRHRKRFRKLPNQGNYGRQSVSCRYSVPASHAEIFVSDSNSDCSRAGSCHACVGSPIHPRLAIALHLRTYPGLDTRERRPLVSLRVDGSSLLSSLLSSASIRGLDRQHRNTVTTTRSDAHKPKRGAITSIPIAW